MLSESRSQGILILWILVCCDVSRERIMQVALDIQLCPYPMDPAAFHPFTQGGSKGRMYMEPLRQSIYNNELHVGETVVRTHEMTMYSTAAARLRLGTGVNI